MTFTVWGLDVAYGDPAQRAGISPSTKIIAVNRRQFNQTLLREAIGRTAHGEKVDRPATGRCSNSAMARSGQRAPRLAPATSNMPRGVSLVVLALGSEQPQKHYKTDLSSMTL
jgi:hypothetical protein